MKGKKAFARQRICVPPLPSQLEKKCNKTLKREMAAFPISQELRTVVNQVSDSYMKARDDLVDHLDARRQRSRAGQPHPLADCYIEELKTTIKDVRKLLDEGDRQVLLP